MEGVGKERPGRSVAYYNCMSLQVKFKMCAVSKGTSPVWSAVRDSRCNRQLYKKMFFLYSLVLMSFRALKYSETPDKLKIQSTYILMSSFEEKVTLLKFIPTAQQDKFKQSKRSSPLH